MDIQPVLLSVWLPDLTKLYITDTDILVLILRAIWFLDFGFTLLVWFAYHLICAVF